MSLGSPAPPAPSPLADAASLLSDARHRACLTQVELAARAGVTQSVISTYENGRREPSLSALRRLLLAAGFEAEVQLRPMAERSGPRERVEQRRAELVAALGALGGRDLRLLDTATTDPRASDVVLAVDLDQDAGLAGLLRMQDEAERILGVRVELLPAASIGSDSAAPPRRPATDDGTPPATSRGRGSG